MLRLIATGALAGLFAWAQVLLIEFDVSISTAVEVSALLEDLSWACVVVGALFAAEWCTFAARGRHPARATVFVATGAWLVFQFCHALSKVPSVISGRPLFGLGSCLFVAAGAFAWLFAFWHAVAAADQALFRRSR